MRFITNKRQLYVGLISYPILIVLDGLILIGTPYLFVKIINLLVIVVLSGILGAFIREIFVLKEKQGENKE